jgi:hypothetical protein
MTEAPTPQRRGHPRVAGAILAIMAGVMALGLARCDLAGSAASDLGGPASTSSAGTSEGTTQPASVPGVVPPDATPGGEPPAASLAAEGGDPVVGQLGSYTWMETGSDAPWLTGAPIAVGSGEPLRVTFEPSLSLDSWRARFLPAEAGDGAGAVSLGTDTGDPAFQAPDPGSWTVVLEVDFAGVDGSASYYWRLDVT